MLVLRQKELAYRKSVVIGYTPLKKVKTTAQKEAKKNYSMAMEAILEGLIDIQKKNIGKCTSTKELWIRLEKLYSNKEQEARVKELMLEDIIDLQKEKIGKCNSVEELSFKINQLNEEQEAKDGSVQDPGKYEGMSLEHSVCNAFKEISLSGIENKSYSELIECNTSDHDENPCAPISDRNLVDIMIDNEITNVSQEVKNLCE